MATNLSSPHHKLDLNSIRILVFSVNQHFDRLLLDSDGRRCIQLSCHSMLRPPKQEFFEFSEHSILSNLFWGIEKLEAAVVEQNREQRSSLLKSSEHMLQVPALLDEDGHTGGVPNQFLVCCSYFYLSIIRKLQSDEWQMTSHVLQAILVSPRLMRTHFAPEIWEFLFLSHIIVENQEEMLAQLCEDEIDDMTKKLARRYKDWMMYYQVVLSKEATGFLWLPKHGAAAAADYFYQEKLCNYSYRRCMSAGCSATTKKPIVSSAFCDVIVENPADSQQDLQEKISDMRDPRFYFDSRRSFTQDDGGLFLKYNIEEKDFSVDDAIVNENVISSKSDPYCMKLPDSDTSISICSQVGSLEESELEEMCNKSNRKVNNTLACLETHDPKSSNGLGKLLHSEVYSPEAIEATTSEENASSIIPTDSQHSNQDLYLTNHRFSDNDEDGSINYNVSAATKLKSPVELPPFFHEGSSGKRSKSRKQAKMMKGFEKAVSTLYFSDTNSEISSIWEVLLIKDESKFELLKGVILDQLLNVIATSKEKELIRASISVLMVLSSENNSVIDEIKKQKTCLHDLASVLKKNVQEAANLIHVMNPSPKEINDLDILHCLVEIVCGTKNSKTTKASIAMIEMLITKLDSKANCKNLSVICSQGFVSAVLEVPKYKNIEEGAYVANIVLMCMRYDRNFRSYISEAAPVPELIHLLRSNHKQAKFNSLELLNDMLQAPREWAANLLHRIRLAGKINIMHSLMACIRQAEPESRIFAANLLLQLDVMEDTGCHRSIFREEAVEVLVEALLSDDNPEIQVLSSFIISNLGGTFSKTGEPLTSAWLLRKAGLSSLQHLNMIKHHDWSDATLEDSGIDAWCSKVVRSLLKIGEPLLQALEKGLESKTRRVSRGCLVAISWIGFEVAKMNKTSFTCTATDTLLNLLVRFLRPNLDLEERLLACSCLYNYTSGRGIETTITITEGLRGSLQRLSDLTWMAQELLRSADNALPSKSHISCVHEQILEISNIGNGAVTSLIFFKGHLYSGHSNGFIKIWNIKSQTAKLVREIKGHRRKITCFALYEAGDCLLSGSIDKSIKVWRIINRKMEPVDIVELKEPILKMETHKQQMLILTPSPGLKVCDAAKNIRTIFRNINIKCISVDEGRVYLGCSDSSVQEVDIASEQLRMMKTPEKRWWLSRRPIYSISVYKNSIYSGSDSVRCLNFKERTRSKLPVLRRRKLLALSAVEDFLYFNVNSSPSTIQICLRKNQRKVGRLSAGGRITSLLTANDVVLCGTDTGLIKGWVPL